MDIDEMTRITRVQLKKLICSLAEDQQFGLEYTDVLLDTGEPVPSVYTTGEVLVRRHSPDEVCELDPWRGTIWFYKDGESLVRVNPDVAKDIRIKGSILYVEGDIYTIARTEGIQLEDIMKDL